MPDNQTIAKHFALRERQTMTKAGSRRRRERPGRPVARRGGLAAATRAFRQRLACASARGERPVNQSRSVGPREGIPGARAVGRRCRWLNSLWLAHSFLSFRPHKEKSSAEHQYPSRRFWNRARQNGHSRLALVSPTQQGCAGGVTGQRNVEIAVMQTIGQLDFNADESSRRRSRRPSAQAAVVQTLNYCDKRNLSRTDIATQQMAGPPRLGGGSIWYVSRFAHSVRRPMNPGSAPNVKSGRRFRRLSPVQTRIL